LVAQPDRLHSTFGFGPIEMLGAEDETAAWGRPPLRDGARFGLGILDNVVFGREGGGRSEEESCSNDKLLHDCVPEIFKGRTRAENVGSITDAIIAVSLRTSWHDVPLLLGQFVAILRLHPIRRVAYTQKHW